VHSGLTNPVRRKFFKLFEIKIRIKIRMNLTKLALIETKFTMKIKKNLKTNPPATASSPLVEAVAVTTRGAASGHHKVLRAGCDYQGDGPAATTRGDGQRCGALPA
jgi:hypothetical protein